jgi:potassium efflux system protein
VQGLDSFQNAVGQIASAFTPQQRSGEQTAPEAAQERYDEAEPIRSADMRSAEAARRRAGA